MILIILVGSISSMIAMGFFYWNKYKNLLEESVYNQELADNYKTSAIVFWVLSGIFLLCICCLISRISLAAKIISASADFLTD